MTTDTLSHRCYLAGVSALFAGCSGTSMLMGQPTRTVSEDTPQTRVLSFGESIALPDVRVTVADPRLHDVQEGTEDGQQETAEAGPGYQWLFVRLATRNTASGVTALPKTMRFEVRVGDALYKPGRNHSREGKYVGGKVPAGERRSVHVGFLVPESVSTGDVAVVYEEMRHERLHRIRWK